MWPGGRLTEGARSVAQQPLCYASVMKLMTAAQFPYWAGSLSRCLGVWRPDYFSIRLIFKSFQIEWYDSLSGFSNIVIIDVIDQGNSKKRLNFTILRSTWSTWSTDFQREFLTLTVLDHASPSTSKQTAQSSAGYSVAASTSAVVPGRGSGRSSAPSDAMAFGVTKWQEIP